MDQVEIDFIICGYLNSDITFDVIDETSFLNHVVLSPNLYSCFFIYLSFEEQYVAWASGNQSAIVH